MVNIEELEKSRIKTVKTISLCSLISVITIVLSYLLITKIQIFLIIISIFLSLMISSVKVRNFKKKYKELVILEVFKNIFTDITYTPNEGISRKTIQKTKMIRIGNSFYSNDYIRAKYKRVPFEFSDIKIQNEYKTKTGIRYIEKIFQGQWFIFDFNKQFKADIQVCEKNFINTRKTTLSNNGIINKIELEDIEFNKTFNVYAKNDLDAFYVLTPNTMEKIKELNKKIHGNMLLCFINNKLHVGLYNNKDLFETSIFKKIDIQRNHQEVKRDILLITQFIDILDLDNTLFRKEVQ